MRRFDLSSENIFAYAGRDIPGYGGDGRAAVDANLSGPVGVASDPIWETSGSRSASTTGSARVDAGGIITTDAGSFQEGFAGDGGQAATMAALNGPEGVAVDSRGRLYIADTGNHRIRMVDPEGVISTVAGTGEAGYSGDGGPGAQRQSSTAP